MQIFKITPLGADPDAETPSIIRIRVDGICLRLFINSHQSDRLDPFTRVT